MVNKMEKPTLKVTIEHQMTRVAPDIEHKHLTSVINDPSVRPQTEMYIYIYIYILKNKYGEILYFFHFWTLETIFEFYMVS